MRSNLVRVMLLSAIVLGNLVLPDAFAASAPGQMGIYPPPSFFQVSGTCSMEVTPDKAVIMGGMSSSGLKPTDATDQLDKQLGLLRSYVAEQHGELQLMERVRTLKNPQPGRQDNDPPFQVVQRLQVIFPADAPVDVILDKLLELGFDRFGDNVLNNFGNRREAVVRYRVSGLDAKLKALQQQCTVNAWKQWCSAQTDKAECASATPPVQLEMQSFNVRSKDTLMRPDGGTAPWQFNINQAQRWVDPPDLLGKLTIHLEGSIFLTYRHEDPKP